MLIINLSLISMSQVCFTFQELAEQRGNRDEAEKIRSELEDLEEKAQHLDKMRSKGLSAIRFQRIFY